MIPLYFDVGRGRSQHSRQKAPSFSLSMERAKHGRDEGRGGSLTSPLSLQCLSVPG